MRLFADSTNFGGRKRLAVALCLWGFAGVPVLDAAAAATVKCVDAKGRVSYQEHVCAEGAQSTVTLPVPPASASPQASIPSSSAQTPARSRVPTEQDFKGPREAWQRMEQALTRGDRDAALKELTPAAQQRLGETIDKLVSKTKPAEFEQWGPVRSVTLSREGTATVTLSRKKADGTYAYEVMLMRGADGKWRIDNM